MIGIIDYGSGNFTSVFNAVFSLSTDIKIISKPEDFDKTTHIILPGVGAFGSSMKKVEELNLKDELENQVLVNKKPYLGICVGMQMIGEEGLEFGRTKGFNWVDCKVEQLCNEMLPHIGWNELDINEEIDILKGIKNKSTFYFVHSYAIKKINDSSKVVHTDYDEKFVSVIQKDNVFGVQFHPEKSQDFGLKLLQNFITL